MKILLTGSTGQLGAASWREFARDCEVIAPAHHQLDLTRHADVMECVRTCRPDAIINCAAYNDVDGAQSHAETALGVNAFAVQSLARAAAETGAVLVHYSTDFVFNGFADKPYTEEDRPNPRSFYSMSKLLGEWFAEDAPQHYVLRVESLFGGCAFGSRNKSSVDRIVDALLEGREATVFSDRTVSPSFVTDVTAATRRLLEIGAPHGLYHCVNSGFTTWLELAREVAAQLNVAPKLVPRKMSDLNLKVDRPLFAAMSNAKLSAVGVPMPTWHDSIRRYVALRTTGNEGGSEENGTS